MRILTILDKIDEYQLFVPAFQRQSGDCVRKIERS